MRVPGHFNRRQPLDSETMTPMIDVVFLLLVFFVCASIGRTPDNLLPAELKAGATESPVKTEPPPEENWAHQQVRIRVSAGGESVVVGSDAGDVRVTLNEQPVSGMAELEQRLRRLAEADPLSAIILDVDDGVLVQQFITVYDLCQLLKFSSISFATRSAGAAGPASVP